MRTHSPAWKLATRFSIVVFLLISGTRSFAQEFPTLEWAKSFGTNPSYDIARSITTDASGNVFSAGGFRNTVDFDPSTGVFNLTAVGFDNRGPYMLKLDPDGNFLWAKTFTSTNTCFMGAITNDASGNLYVTGSFDGTVDFDPGPGTFNITNTGSFDSNFICKLDANGNFLWATNTTSNNSQAIASIAVDATQNVYTLGHFRGTVDFDPGTGISSLTPFGQWDVYLTKTGPSGNFISVQRLGGTDFDFGGSIGTDAAGNVYLSGVFQGTADFDPGAGTFNMTSSGLRDIFVVKLTAAGNFVWAKRLGEAATDELGMAIKTDASGNIYATGLYSGTWDFDPNTSVFNLTSSGGTDFYLLKLNANGDFVWAKSMGSSTHDDRVTDLAIDPTGVYATGYFNGTADFDPGPGTFTLTASNDSYLLKLDLNGDFLWVAPSGDYGAGSVTKVITIDAAGNIFATGGFIAPLDADPDPCTEVGLLTGLIYLQKLSIGVAGGSCSPPAIISFTPTSGTFGTTVTITGTNFSIIPANNGVQFNGISATVTSSSATSITCEVPAGATTGPITVTVGGQSDTSTNDFTVTGSTITITTQPTSATVCDGTIVTFTTAATGTTNIIYQWQIEDPDGDWIDVINGGGYSGATTPVLTVNTSSNFGEGTYQCLVSGDFASNVDTNDVFLDIAPNAPFISDVVTCGPGAVTVTASGGTNGQYRWYTQASGGTAIPGEVNGIFTTPFLTSTTLYYVAINNGVCEGPRSDVQVAISTCQPQPGLVWAQGMGVGTMANGTNGGNTVLIDADGNLLVCGSFQGTIDFDNGPGTANLTAGGTDSFLLKMTPSGTLLWAKGIGGPGSDGVGGMSIDAAGNIYMVFEFSGTSDFDPGAAVAPLTSTPSSPANKSDLAVAKYDRDGNFIWVRRIGGNNDERTGGLTTDAAGNVYITGQFRGTTNFNGSFPRTALGANSTDVLFAKMDANGTFLWAGSIGSPLATAANLFSDGGSAIDIDGTGNVYVSGRVFGPNTTVDFDPGTGTATQVIVDDRAGFVLKLNNSGVYQDHYVVEGAAGNEVSIDASGNIYFTGAFTGTVDIDPGPGVFSVTGNGANYITKLNSSGSFVWGKMLNPGGFGVSPSVLIRGIVFDAAGDLHITGYNTTGATDFDLGPLEETRGLNGLFVLNPFVWKLNSNGDFNWVITMRRISGSFATASIASVAVSTTGDIFTTGNFARNVDLDPGLCEFGVTNLNGSDIFISRLSPAQPNVCIAQQPTNVSACDNDIATLTVGVAEAGSIFYQWQKLNTTTSQFENISNTGGYAGTTTSTLSVNTTGTFGAGQYRCRVSGSSTVSGFSNPATLTFLTSTVLQTTGASGCSSSTVTLFASGGLNGQYRWYSVATGGTAIAGEVNDSFTTPVLTTTTTYYVTISNGTCESVRVPVVATMNALPDAPTVTPNSNCGAGAVALSASGGAAGEYRWYAVATGGTAIAGEVNGSFTTLALTATTTYYVSINNGTCESARVPVVATINVLPATPTVTPNSNCGAGTVALAASGGAAGEYRWYAVATGGTAIAGEVNGSFTTSALTATTTYYVSINNGTCESARVPVLATINALPVAPTVSGASRCGSGTVTLTASGGSAGQYRWYSVPTGGSAIIGETNAALVITSLSTNTTYYVSLNTGVCESSRTAVVATINSVPAKPTITASGTLALCAGQSVILSAPAGFSYLWSNGSSVQQITVTTAGSFTVVVSNVNCSSVPSDAVVTTTAVCNQPPVITTSTSSTPVESKASINLSQLISDPDNNLDLTTLRVVGVPKSRAVATIVNGVLLIDYSGVSFAGLDEIIIEVCDLAGVCVQQTILIEVIGEVVVYNGLSANDDQLNAAFLLRYIELLPETQQNTVSIYNRWGDEVWQGVNYNNTSVVFTGLNKNGNVLPSGTYFYKVEFASGKKTITGYLSLKR